LVRKIGGASPAAHADISAADCARILRVPGTLNHKRQDEPRQVKVVRNAASSFSPITKVQNYSDAPRTFAEWYDFLPPVQYAEYKPKRAPQQSYTNSGMLTDGLKRWAEQGYPQGKRHKDLSGAAAWLIRDCKLAEQDAEILLRIKAQNSPGIRQITDHEISDMIRWASR
jgi:hypothetical protein